MTATTAEEKMERTIPIQNHLQRTREESYSTIQSIEKIQCECKKKEVAGMGQKAS
jgi:hypothetical protein